MKISRKMQLSCEKEEIPSWVLRKEVDNSTSHHNKNRVLLIDYQVNLIEKSSFFNMISQVRNGADMQNDATISVNFDQDYQRVAFHRLQLHRAGQVIDKIDSCKMQTAQQEKGSERHIYDGSQTVFFFLDDIREGDKIEYAYTITGFNPIYSSHYDYLCRFSFPEPIAYKRLRYIKSKQQPLFFQDFGTNIPHKIKELSNDHEEWVWEAENSGTFLPESHQPFSFVEPGFVQISTFKSWHDVAEWAASFYRLPDHFPLEIEEFVSGWKELSLKEQILSAIRFVQDNVRYLGFEDGINGFKPKAPEIVFKCRFGDCKDKTHLLQTMLALLGVESCPVLVNSHQGPSLRNYFPSSSVFNHVILKISVLEKNYWIDSTISFQGGDLDHCYCPDYQHGLEIKKGTYDLTYIPSKAVGETKVVTLFDVRDDECITMQVVSSFHDGDADYFRWKNISSSPNELAQNYLNYYSTILGPLKSTEILTIEDNRKENLIVIKESYHLDHFWDINLETGQRSFLLEPFALKYYLTIPIESDRRTPVAHIFPFRYREEFHFLKKQPWPADNSIDEFEGEAFKFQLTILADENTLGITYTYESLKHEVSPENLKEHKALLNKVLHRSILQVFDDALKPPQKSIFSMIGEAFFANAGKIVFWTIGFVYILLKVILK